MIKANELRIGNLLFVNNKIKEIYNLYSNGWDFLRDEIDCSFVEYEHTNPIPLTEEWLLKFGFSVINENSAGKRYGYVINGIFSSDLTFTFWKTTKEVGKFFRGDLELKSVHQLQNLYFALTGSELTVA